MATSLDFSRAVNLNIKSKASRKFTAVLVFSRDDSGAVDFTGKTLIFRWYDKFGATTLLQWGVNTGFAVSTDTITFNLVPEDLTTEVDFKKGVYSYEFYNETDLQAIAYGKIELI